MRHRFILILISLLTFALVLSATNNYSGSDPKFTLLVSQSIVDNGTIRLDAYSDDLLFDEPVQKHILTHVITEQDGHLYNYFPVGPSIITLPVMTAMRLSGMDMRQVEDNFFLQKILAAFTCVLMVWIIYGIARCYLDQSTSVIIAAVSILGTALISSMGTALWTVNFSTLFIGLSVLLLVRYETEKTSSVRPVILGVLLFLSFFSPKESLHFRIAAGYIFHYAGGVWLLLL